MNRLIGLSLLILLLSLPQRAYTSREETKTEQDTKGRLITKKDNWLARKMQQQIQFGAAPQFNIFAPYQNAPGPLGDYFRQNTGPQAQAAAAALGPRLPFPGPITTNVPAVNSIPSFASLFPPNFNNNFQNQGPGIYNIQPGYAPAVVQSSIGPGLPPNTQNAPGVQVNVASSLIPPSTPIAPNTPGVQINVAPSNLIQPSTPGTSVNTAPTNIVPPSTPTPGTQINVAPRNLAPSSTPTPVSYPTPTNAPGTQINVAPSNLIPPSSTPTPGTQVNVAPRSVPTSTSSSTPSSSASSAPQAGLTPSTPSRQATPMGPASGSVPSQIMAKGLVILLSLIILLPVL